MGTNGAEADRLLHEARRHAAAGDLEQARAAVNRALAFDPTSVRASELMDALMRQADIAVSAEPETFIDRLGIRWAILGWILFACWLMGYFLIGPVAWAISSVLWLAWWIADAIDQRPAAWQVAVGAAMFAVGLLPRASSMFVVVWVIYWTRVRE
ncbi:MAG: hypothetical protein FJX72_17160 [Armatimonadetes bacterium]|nr:hypothetical protein [Armatimonadota bacterium]